MMGLALGAAAVFGIAAIRRAHCRRAWAWHHHGMHGCGGSGWHGGYGGWQGRGWGGHSRPWMWAVLARLDLSPAQEKLVRTEVEQLAERMRTLRGELKGARADVGRAVAGEVFDRGALDAMYARHDQLLDELRGAVADSLQRVHEALDARQRETLSEMLGGGLWKGMGFGGPYRA